MARLPIWLLYRGATSDRTAFAGAPVDPPAAAVRDSAEPHDVAMDHLTGTSRSWRSAFGTLTGGPVL